MNTCIDSTLHNNILRYYTEAGADYGFWSKSFHMHFGLGTLVNLFNREGMLNKMSDEVIKRMELGQSSSLVADFGCGVGTTMRRAAENNPDVKTIGFTLVPHQKEMCETINKKFGDRVSVRVEDFHRTSLSAESCTGVYCIESACYSPEPLHAIFFKEVFRVLRKGGRLVIADGFLKTDPAKLKPWIRTQYDGICHNWSLPGMMQIENTRRHLQRAGFKVIHIEEVSWRVATSVLHVPFVIIWFLLYKKMKGKALSVQSTRNLKGSLQTLLLGLNRKNFGYYLITAEK